MARAAAESAALQAAETPLDNAAAQPAVAAPPPPVRVNAGRSRSPIPAPPVRVRPTSAQSLAPPHPGPYAPPPAYAPQYGGAGYDARGYGFPGVAPPPAYAPSAYAPPPPPKGRRRAARNGRSGDSGQYAARDKQQLGELNRQRKDEFGRFRGALLSSGTDWAEMHAITWSTLAAAGLVFTVTLFLALVRMLYGSGPMPAGDLAAMGLAMTAILLIGSFVFAGFSPQCLSNKRQSYKTQMNAFLAYIRREEKDLLEALDRAREQRSGSLMRPSGGGLADIAWLEYKDFYDHWKETSDGLRALRAKRPSNGLPGGLLLSVSVIVAALLLFVLFNAASNGGGVQAFLIAFGFYIAVTGAAGVYRFLKDAKFAEIDRGFVTAIRDIALDSPQDHAE